MSGTLESPGGQGLWPLMAAGAFMGMATGGFVASVMVRFLGSGGAFAPTYEGPAALVAGLGVWLFSPQRTVGGAVTGAIAAAAAMLLGDLFRAMSLLDPAGWRTAPVLVAQTFRDGSWTKLVRYAFGVYVGWYLGYHGRACWRKAPPGEGD